MSNEKAAPSKPAPAAEAADMHTGIDLPTVDQVIDTADAQRRGIEQAAKEAGVGFWNHKAPFMERTTRGELASNVAVGVGIGLAAYGVYRLVKDVFFADGESVVAGLTDAMGGLGGGRL